MITEQEYYTAPSDITFEEIKAAAIQIWQTYDDEYGYATSKINRIKDITNVRDNAWYIVAMFDWLNQQKLLTLVSPDTRAQILRIINNSIDNEDRLMP